MRDFSKPTRRRLPGLGRALVLMNGADDLGPEIAGAQVASTDAFVEPIHRDEDLPQPISGNQTPGRFLNARNHSLPVLER